MALGLQEQGRLLVAKGEVTEGLALLDEATVMAVSGELTPMSTGIIYCNAIDVCRRLADFRRAGEWTDAARQWCDRQRILGFPGVCRVYRAGILRLRGAWLDAAREAANACEELRPYDVSSAAEAFYELGEIRLRLGDLPAAEEAFRQAHELGRDPQPGLARLRLAQGKIEAARTGIRSALADGLHAASAQRSGHAYRGKGVHVAARLAAVARAGEILASRETVEPAVPGIKPSEPRAVELKGVTAPLDVVSVDRRRSPSADGFSGTSPSGAG